MLMENIKYSELGRAYKEVLRNSRGKVILARRYGVIKKCLDCNNDFFSDAYRENKFCTLECRDKFMSKGNHHRWNGGMFLDKDGYVHVQTDKRSKYKLQHVLIIEKDRPLICHICKSTENMLIHHNDENKLNNATENLTVLCRPCHQRVHSVMRGNKTTKHYKEILEFVGRQ